MGFCRPKEIFLALGSWSDLMTHSIKWNRLRLCLLSEGQYPFPAIPAELIEAGKWWCKLNCLAFICLFSPPCTPRKFKGRSDPSSRCSSKRGHKGVTCRTWQLLYTNARLHYQRLVTPNNLPAEKCIWADDGLGSNGSAPQEPALPIRGLRSWAAVGAPHKGCACAWMRASGSPWWRPPQRLGSSQRHLPASWFWSRTLPSNRSNLLKISSDCWCSPPAPSLLKCRHDAPVLGSNERTRALAKPTVKDPFRAVPETVFLAAPL